MKKSIIAFLFLFVATPALFVACSKKNTAPTAPAPPFSVTAAINGVPTTFNAIITVDSSSTPGTVYIVAHADSANLTPLLEITLTGKTPLTAGTYPIADSTGGNQSVMGYTGWAGDQDIQYNGISDTVILTTVNKTWLAGTFQGTCQFALDSAVSVTNGQFTVGWNEQ
jgi:hypothetical protein